MPIRKVASCLSIAALMFIAAPVGAQDFAPDTVWGQAPQSVTAKAANAVLSSTGGANVGTVPVVGGKFEFAKVAPGQYTVTLTDGAGAKLATSHVATLAEGAVVKAIFDDNPPAAAAAKAASHKTAWIVVGAAAAAGITTAVVVNNNNNKNNNPPASGSR